MREFTPEEKELIINTPITFEVFDINIEIVNRCTLRGYLSYLEGARLELKEYRNHKNFEKGFDIFVRLLPNSYKVVKL